MENVCFVDLMNGEAVKWSEPTCQIKIFEVVAPLFLWLSCVGLVLFTLYFVLKFILESKPLARRFSKLKKAIDAIHPKDKPLDGIGLEQLRALMARDKVLSEPWSEFEETLLVDTSNATVGAIFNTRQAEEYFSEEALIAPRVNTRFYSALPGILTSIGLLLTFIAILIGLSHIKPDASGKLTGVEDLVYSLSGKFISSICALLLATLFTFLDKRLTKSLHRSYQSFISTLNRRFARMPSEHLLRDIRHDIGQQSRAFLQFGTDLSGHLKESFREGMDPLVQRVAAALEELAKQKQESLTESLSSVIGEFKSSLMGSTNNEFKLLADSIGKTATLLQEMNQNNQVTQQRTAEMISNFDELLSKQSNSGQEQLTRLVQTMESIMDKLRTQAEQSSSALDTSVESLLTKLTETTTTQMTEQARRTEEMSISLRGLIEQVKESSVASSSSIQSTVTSVLDQTSSWSSQTSEKVIQILDQQSRNAQTIEGAKEALEVSLSTFKSAVEQAGTSLRSMENGSRGIQDGITTLNSSINGASRIQQTTSDISALTEKNLRQLTTVVDHQSGVLQQYERTFTELDKSIGQLLGLISSNLENYSARVKSSLEEHLSQFDNTLGNATAKLGTTVQQLSESLEEIIELANQSKAANN